MEELSLHILDIARNSIEAGADRIEITISESMQDDFFCFKVKDNGPGIDKELLPGLTNPFFTTKQKRKKVGLGLALLQEAAERCEGRLIISASPGMGTEVKAIFRRSHIDRAPLGDLPGTITVLLMEQGLSDLAYTHDMDGKSFSFSLSDLKARLGSIPPGRTDVLGLVRAHLEDGIKELYGGVKTYEIP